MNEVAASALEAFFRAARKRRIAPERLIEGTGYALAHYRQRYARIDWSAFARFMRNASAIWTAEELVGIGTTVMRTSALRAALLGARLLFTPMDFYSWVFTKERGVGDLAFSCLGSELERTGPDRLRLTIWIREGYEPVPEMFLITCGNLRGIPRLLGFPMAEVEMEATGRAATFRVKVPRGGGLLPALWRALRFPFTARAAALELHEAQEALFTREADLERLRVQLDANARQLANVNEIGSTLAQHRDLGQVAGEALRFLLQELGAKGAAFWAVRREGEPLQEVLREGGTSGEPRRIPLRSGGQVSGQIDVWGVRDGEAALLDALAPWLAIAVDNARYSALHREAQMTLEQRVKERTAELRQRTADLDASLQRITELDRLKTEFFANASHELRTPLTLVCVPLDRLLASPATPEELRRDLRGISRAANQLLKLVNDLLDLQRLEAGRMALRPGKADLAQIAAEAVRSFRASLESRRVRIEQTGAAAAPLVADSERLEQVAMNLLSNAARHVPDGGWIRVSVSAAEGGAELVVENSGEGIDPRELPRVFERFLQAANAPGRRFGSSGLGLPLARELVALHGGSIEVENHPGERVAFRVRLPAGPPAEPPRDPSPKRPRPGRLELAQYLASAAPDVEPPPELAPEGGDPRPLIVIAEDNAELRALLSRELGEEYRVLEAEDGAQALELVRARGPELVLADVMMPRLDGFQLCARIKGDPDLASIPVVMLTARADVESRLTGLIGGADDYVAKPFHVEELRARLGIQLRVRRLANRLAEREKLAALGVLVAGAAHELRNPLNGILNSLRPLQELLGDTSPECRRLLEVAVTSAARIEELAAKLLAQARAGDGQRTEVDVRRTLRLAVELFAAKARVGPRIACEIPEDGDLEVIGDPGALGQVWMNLLDNAIEAAGAGGAVTVGARRDGAAVVAEVRDTGPGIPPHLARRIFDPFFTTKPVGKGTGLGLSIVRDIIRRHGGEVELRSTLGEGATFRVTLPAARREGQA